MDRRPRYAHRFFVGAVAALTWLGAARAAPLSVADAFKATPIVFMWLSPDGQRLLAHGFGVQGAPGVIVMDVATMTPKLVRSERGGWPLTARWLGSELIVVAMRSETQIFDASGKFVRAVNGRLLATLPPDAQGHERFLVTSGYDSVARIDVREVGSTRILYAWPPGVPRQWLVDRDGVPRVVTTATADATMLTHWYRRSATDPWEALESQLAVESRWLPLAISRDGRSLMVASSEGRDTTAIFRYSLEERALKDMLAGHPTEDIGDVASAGSADETETAEGDAGTFVRVVTLGMKTTVHWFDPRWAAVQRAVDVALPGRINSLSGSFEAGRLLVFSTGDVDPGTWHILELAGMSLRAIDVRKPEIDRKAMAPMQVVSYRSADGLEIPAYLTLPPGGGRDLPAVVLVHGGPVVRNRWGWDPEVQMLASRGYAVLQPQFRGSGGFGKRFERAGYHEWGRTMQDDVSAGAEWLVRQGIADPRRICIYGGSYGGYAALWALVKTPQLFRCGASLAGVSDLGLMFRDSSDTNRSALGRLFRLRMVGDPKDDADRLDQVSPLLGVGRIQAPVLLAHGDKDERVPIVHSEQMLQALKAAGKQVEWIELKGEGHGIARKTNRERFYGALFEFLRRNTQLAIDGTPAAAATGAVSAPSR